ncbi:MAG: tetraacyldisaccharide 4'-kinase [Thiohalomonadales bacterium]
MLDIEKIWYRGSTVRYALLPLSWLFGVLVFIRRSFYQLGILKTVRLPVPVIVVGNISIGGTGKTPLVEAVAKYFSAKGRRPGIISRGYGGQSKQWPLLVETNSAASLVGDEPLLLAQRANCPVAVGPDRVAAAKMLLTQENCDLIISDDGLQHYRLARDVEIAVIDGVRGLGNRHLLPAGPLRENETRLQSVDIVVVNDGEWPGAYTMQFCLQNAVSLSDNSITKSLASFKGQTVHAVAGIGRPERFFRSLQGLGLDLKTHPFPDHYRFNSGDCEFSDDLAVLMTEKDAVKVREFAVKNQYYVPISVELDKAVYNSIEKKIALKEGSSLNRCRLD